MQLDRAVIEELRDQFFSRSTATHRYQMDVAVLGIGGDHEDYVKRLRLETKTDWRTIKKIVGGSLFYRSPRLFYLGVTNHFGLYGSLRKETILKEVIPKLRFKTLNKKTELFRIRVNLDAKQQFDKYQFDSPPAKRRHFSRFENSKLPVLYASPSMKVCIHECRVTLADDVFIATLRPTTKLRLIDLSGNYDEPEDIDPFDSVEWFLRGLMFSSRPDVHRHCRRIAQTIKEETRCDGIVYNSYFMNVVGDNSEPQINYGIFGNPINEGKLRVSSINTVKLEQIAYDFRLGPIFE